MQLGEFFIALGFDVDDQSLQDFQSGMDTLRNTMLAVPVAAAGALLAMSKFSAGSVRAATALHNFNNETGDAIDGLQKWQAASQLSNAAASADGVTSSFQAMAQAISDVKMGRGGGEFQMLGISDVRGREVADVLEEMRIMYETNVSRYGRKQTLSLMESVGFDRSMLPALQMTRNEFQRISETKIISQEQVDTLVSLGKAFNSLRVELNLFKDEISATFAPVLIDVINKILYMRGAYNEEFRAVLDFADRIYDKFLRLFNLLTGFRNLRGEVDKNFTPVPAEMFSRVPADYGGSTIQNLYGGALAPTNQNDRLANRIIRNNQTNMNNVWNIATVSDESTLSDLIIRRQQQLLNNTYADEVPNGSAY